MVVHHCTPGAQCHIGGAQWLCTTVHRVHNAMLLVHNAILLVHNGRGPSYWWCTMVVHHCAPGAQCHIAGAQWSCTIILVVHNGRAPLCTGCTMPYWWCTMPYWQPHALLAAHIQSQSIWQFTPQDASAQRAEPKRAQCGACWPEDEAVRMPRCPRLAPLGGAPRVRVRHPWGARRAYASGTIGGHAARTHGMCSSPS